MRGLCKRLAPNPRESLATLAKQLEPITNHQPPTTGQMTTTTTREVLRNAVEREQLRFDIASGVLALLRKHEGKKLTKRLLPAICEITGEDTWYSDTYGLQALETRGYRSSDGNGGMRFFLGHGEGCWVISGDVFEEKNCCYLAAAAARISKNSALLASDWPERVDQAAAAVTAAQDAYRALAGMGSTSECLTIAKAHGFKSRDGRSTAGWV